MNALYFCCLSESDFVQYLTESVKRVAVQKSIAVTHFFFVAIFFKWRSCKVYHLRVDHEWRLGIRQYLNLSACHSCRYILKYQLVRLNYTKNKWKIWIGIHHDAYSANVLKGWCYTYSLSLQFASCSQLTPWRPVQKHLQQSHQIWTWDLHRYNIKFQGLAHISLFILAQIN